MHSQRLPPAARAEALAALLRDEMQFVMKKFELTQSKFDAIMGSARREARDYPSHYFLFHTLSRYKNVFRKIATSA